MRAVKAIGYFFYYWLIYSVSYLVFFGLLSVFIDPTKSALLMFCISPALFYAIYKSTRSRLKKKNEAVSATLENNHTQNKVDNMTDDNNDDDLEYYEADGVGFRLRIRNSWEKRHDDEEKAFKTCKWIGKGEILKIGSFKIQDPMIYITDECVDFGPHFIISTKSKISKPRGRTDICYYPNYFDIEPEERWTYLEWLQDGKKDPNADNGCVFLYLYGLERRFLNDNSTASEFLEEVCRLYSIYKRYSGLERHCRNLILMLIEYSDKVIGERAYNLIKAKMGSWYSSYYRKDMYFREKGEVVEDDLISAIPHFDQTARSSIPKKVGEIFYKYYVSQNQELLNESIQKSEIKTMVERYNPIMGSYSNEKFETVYTHRYDLKLPASFKRKLGKAWERAVDDFRPYSRSLGKKSKTELFALLPEILKTEMEHPLKKRVVEFAKDKDMELISIEELHKVVKSRKKDKYTPTENASLCSAFRASGVAIEPDLQYFRKTLKKDDNVVISLTDDLSRLDCDDYRVASLLCDFAIDLSYSDGELDCTETEAIYDFISKNFATKAIDQKHLKMRLKLFSKEKPKLSSVFKKLNENLGKKELKMLCEFIMTVALADGKLSYEEDKKIRNTIKKLGMKENYTEELYSKFGLDFKNIVLRDAGQNNEGSKIPKEPRIIELDKNLLKDLEGETLKVREVLGSVLTDEVDEEEIKDDPPPLPTIDTSGDLDSNHRNFFEAVILKDSWVKSEIMELAKQNGLMLNSAISKVNDWCEEKYDDYLIYDEGEFIIELDILKNIKESA